MIMMIQLKLYGRGKHKLINKTMKVVREIIEEEVSNIMI